MAGRIVEFYGFEPRDPAAGSFVSGHKCIFTDQGCIKNVPLGCCTLELADQVPVICCPNRLYADSYGVLLRAAEAAFGLGVKLIKPEAVKAMKDAGILTGKEVAAFGRNWGKELRIPQPSGADDEDNGSFSIDWVLAHVDTDGNVTEFTAVEVQSIDTTDSYRPAAEKYAGGEDFIDAKGRNPGWTKAGLNWGNVSKRILPQLIYKGYVLRREARCTKGLFFVCPEPVLKRIKARLGGKLLEYPMASGTITFHSYDLGPRKPAGQVRDLTFVEAFTTTVEQLAYAFVSPTNLPDMGVYEKAINAALEPPAPVIRRRRRTPSPAGFL